MLFGSYSVQIPILKQKIAVVQAETIHPAASHQVVSSIQELAERKYHWKLV